METVLKAISDWIKSLLTAAIMDVGPLFGLFLQSFLIGITMRILSIVIFVIVYRCVHTIYRKYFENPIRPKGQI